MKTCGPLPAAGASIVRNKCGLPGTELKKIIARFQRFLPWIDLSGNRSCGCEDTAQWMDFAGCNVCQENVEHIVDKLESEAKKRGITVPFRRAAAKVLVTRSIRKARCKGSDDYTDTDLGIPD